MPRQVQRELDPGREFGKALVDADLEVERAVLMPQHDRAGDRRVCGAQRHDLALAGGGKRCRRLPDEPDIAVMLHQRGAARAFPAAGFQREKYLHRCCDGLGRARHVEANGALLGEAIALAA